MHLQEETFKALANEEMEQKVQHPEGFEPTNFWLKRHVLYRCHSILCRALLRICTSAECFFQELYEKSTIYDDMVERHQKQLEAKQEEMDQEVEACNRIYQTRLAEIEAAQEAKWQNLVRSCYKQFEVA